MIKDKSGGLHALNIWFFEVKSVWVTLVIVFPSLDLISEEQQ